MIKTNTSFSLEKILNATLTEIYLGESEVERGNLEDATKHYYCCEPLFSICSREYNVVNLGWPNDLPQAMVDKIRKILLLHKGLLEKIHELYNKINAESP